MALSPGTLPRYLVIGPTSTVRLEVRFDGMPCELLVELDPPRSLPFTLGVSEPGGPIVRRVRLTGGARLRFDRPGDGPHLLLLANPQSEPLVLGLRLRKPRAPRPGALAHDAAAVSRRATGPVSARGHSRMRAPAGAA